MLSLILGESTAGKLYYSCSCSYKDNIFSSGKLPCLASKQGVQRVGRGGLDGIRRQLASAGCQGLITLLAGKDGREAQRSALSPRSRKSAQFGSWPFSM